MINNRNCQFYNSNCPFYNDGFNKINCPLQHTGKFAETRTIPVEIQSSIFTNMQYISIYNTKPRTYSFQEIKNSIQINDVENFWDALTKLYEDCKTINEYFEALKEICNPETSFDDKIISVLKLVYKKRNEQVRNHYNPPKYMFKIAFDEIVEQVKKFVKNMDFCKNSLNKDFVEFMIDVIINKSYDRFKERFNIN